MKQTLPPNRQLLTVNQFCEEYPAFSKGSIRWILFNRQTNGFNRAVRMLGRRILIDVNEFYLWLDQQNEG